MINYKIIDIKKDSYLYQYYNKFIGRIGERKLAPIS